MRAAVVEIDEKLVRHNLTPAERARLTARRKELYEAAHPETKKGGTGRSRGKVSQLETYRSLYRGDGAQDRAIGNISRPGRHAGEGAAPISIAIAGDPSHRV
jgi:hypothetical protein